MAGVFGFGNPGGGMDGAGMPGVRVTPGFAPTPNSEPMGSITGVPVRTQFYSRPILTGSSPSQIVNETRENKVALITPPNVGFTVYIGDASVSVLTGMPLIPGVVNEIILPGLQPVFAVTDAPVMLRIGVQIAPILLAERERRY